MSKNCIKSFVNKCVKIESYIEYFLIYLLYIRLLLCIWIRKLVLKEFWMLVVVYKRHEREFRK